MKDTAKRIGSLAASLVAMPLWLAYMMLTLAFGAERAFPGFSQLVALLPGTAGVYLRRAFYGMVLPRCGEDAFIGFMTVLSHPTASVGDRVYVGPFGMLGDVTLEDDALIGSHVSIINGARQHGTERLDIPVREQPGEYPRVTVGRDCWIGDRSIVMCNVGSQAIVGAGSVVTKLVADRDIVAGNPARVIGSRNGDRALVAKCADAVQIDPCVDGADEQPEFRTRNQQQAVSVSPTTPPQF